VWLKFTILSTEAHQPRIGYQSEHERYLTEKYPNKPVIVLNYPKAIRAFYLRLNDDAGRLSPR
jgi:aspartyl/asparaginyl-tRNA synthetase